MYILKLADESGDIWFWIGARTMELTKETSSIDVHKHILKTGVIFNSEGGMALMPGEPYPETVDGEWIEI